MNRGSFIRKVLYIVLIAALLVPLSYYSQPDVIDKNNQLVGGGKLAQLRKDSNISESSLGEIDPTGETIKLATLGLRGVAANLLWYKADKAKMKEDWDGFQAAVDQIAKLEPHYVTVWDYQGWNVSYNISVEWDDYHDRYFWLKEGIKFFLKGIRYNDHEPVLPYRIGWFTAQKMGTADEKIQFRRLFHDDDDEEFPNHRLRPQNRRDNWLVGQEWFEKAVALVEDRGASIRKQNPAVFFSEPAMCQIDYAIALQDDGIFEEKAKIGWSDADNYWSKFGQRSLPTTWGIEVRMGDEESLHQQSDDLIRQLDALSPGLREKLVQERRAKLTSHERDVLDTPPQQRLQDDLSVAFGAMAKIRVPHQELADRLDEPLREKGKKLANEAARLQEVADIIHRERDIVNFKYWRMRCQAEKMDVALEGRRLLYEANDLLADSQLEEARDAYNKGFDSWQQVVERFPELRNDQTGGAGIEDAIKGYYNVLRQLEESFPEDFPLKEAARTMMLRNSFALPSEFADMPLSQSADKNEDAESSDRDGKGTDENKSDENKSDENE